jgi:hypothetical protein
MGTKNSNKGAAPLLGCMWGLLGATLAYEARLRPTPVNPGLAGRNPGLDVFRPMSVRTKAIKFLAASPGTVINRFRDVS